jgi:hypothetical protein
MNGNGVTKIHADETSRMAAAVREHSHGHSMAVSVLR